MSMKTTIKKERNQVVIAFEGKLDFETADQFRNSLTKLDTPLTAESSVIFDFDLLQFVGSSGISAFIQVLREFNSKTTTKPKYVNVKNEFKKIILAFDTDQSFDFDDQAHQRSYRKLDN